MSGTRRVVALILDGLRRDFVTPELTPHLARLKARGAWCGRHRSVFPSVTRVVTSSFATGCLPSRHGLAGNTIALAAGDDLALFDVGKPDFLDHKLRLTGHVLKMPTLAERLAGDGGVVVVSNVSPGAAYLHDPLGHGHVYHRAGSFAPGRTPILGAEALVVGADLEGDRGAVDRFIDQVVRRQKPSLALAWLGHPDATQHEVPLGSPRHREALAIVDGHAGEVIAAVESARAQGEDILLLVGSDHGHQSVSGVVDIGADLVAAGLKAAADSREVVVAPNGTAALIYVDRRRPDLLAPLSRHLARCDWAGRVIGPGEFSRFGVAPGGGLAFAIAMAADDEALNEYGVPGLSLAAKPAEGKADRLGCGQHGGLGRYEQSPFLILEGHGFARGEVIEGETSAIDVAPTILASLGRQADGLDGRALQSITSPEGMKHDQAAV